MTLFGNPDITIGADNGAQAQTSLHACLVKPGEPNPQNPFSGFFVFQVDNVGPQDQCQPVFFGQVGPAVHPLHAIRAWSAAPGGRGVVGIGDVGESGAGIHGQAGNPSGVDPGPPGVDNSGVLGTSISTNPNAGLTPAGVTGQSDFGYGVYGFSTDNAAVVGVGGATGVFGVGGPGNTGVVGQGGSGTADGVRGFGTGSFSGVAGFGDPNAGTGIYGQGAVGVRGIGNGGPNTAPAAGVGVYGQAGPNSNGVEGHGAGQGSGVAGFTADSGIAVEAVSTGVGGLGLFATDVAQGGQEVGQAAGWFYGRVVVDGDLLVSGAKHAAVRQRDGSHRLLYSIESPESWFEDFGEGRLVKGKARVRLEPGFASQVKADSFHVFLTPYGDSNGLYVSQRSKQGFEVREQGNGKAGVRFSYRIVARRKDIKGQRLAKIALKPRRFASKPPTKLRAVPGLPEQLAKIALPKGKPKKLESRGGRQK